MSFIEFSTAFSLDFGRRRKTQLPDGFELEEIDVDSETEVAEDDSDAPKLGFQPNPEGRDD